MAESFRTEYAPEDVIGKNLQELTQRFEALSEQELGHIRELASELIKEHSGLSDVLSSLPDRTVFKQTVPNANLPPKSRHLSEAMHSVNLSYRKFLLAEELADLLSERTRLTAELFFPDPVDPSPVADARMIYQKSNYTDAAFLQFSAWFPTAHAAYAHSFPAACEEVFNGVCKYCILPIENTSEGTLHSFLRLIKQYELKINAVCNITDPVADRTTQFALLGKQLCHPFPATEAETFFVFSLPARERNLSEILASVTLFRMQLHRIDMLSESASEQSVRVQLQVGNGDLPSFLLYLAIQAPHYTPLGWYSHIGTVSEDLKRF